MKIVAINLLLAGTVILAANLPVLPKLAEFYTESRSVSPDHQPWDELLQKHVSAQGRVDYKALKKDSKKLEAYLETLKKNPVRSDWSRREKMAYWINAYNAFTVKLILDNYPVSSIRDLHDGNPWDVQWIKLGEKTYSLNNIENDILRPQFGDARIHFAVNCAARSCPPLRNGAYFPQELDEALDEQTRKFINDPAYNSLSTRQLSLSKIFEWYASDFGKIRDFLNKYADSPIPETATVVYKEYDWGLNE
jgi:hypothetical protein